MKGLIATTSLIMIFIILILLSFSLPMIVVLILLATISIPSIAMIFLVWLRGLEITKGYFDERVIRYWFPPKLKKNNPKLEHYFISKTIVKESRNISFFKLLFELWGFATMIIVSTVTVADFVGLKYEQTDSTSGYEMPSPYSAPGFVLLAYLFGIPISFRMIMPNRIMTTANLRHRDKNNNIISTVPTRKLNIISGLGGITSFALYFFHDISSKSILEIYEILVNSLMYVLLIGIPISLFCLFYIYNIESKVKPKLLAYLNNELGIKIE